jgi:hypothetical protein
LGGKFFFEKKTSKKPLFIVFQAIAANLFQIWCNKLKVDPKPALPKKAEKWRKSRIYARISHIYSAILPILVTNNQFTALLRLWG